MRRIHVIHTYASRCSADRWRTDLLSAKSTEEMMSKLLHFVAQATIATCAVLLAIKLLGM